MITLEFKGIPKPKQSARFRIMKNKAGKQFIGSYQKKDIMDSEDNIGYSAIMQLPEGFVPYDCAISVTVDYIFPIPTTLSKKVKQSIIDGAIVYKSTRPDLGDNINKLLLDSLTGIVYVDDSRIAHIEARKYYGTIPMTKIKIKEL